MSTQSVLEYASRKINGVPRLPPVVGGSGRRYWTIADALAGESGQVSVVTGVVPQAGTVAGTVVFQAGQSAVNSFYKDFYVLDTDTTPSTGLVSQWGRVSNYVGATRTATIDKPWDFSAESDVAIIKPARIALEEDMSEDVVVTIPVEIDLQGHKIIGKVDVTAGRFCWIRGGKGYITNGVQKTDFGLLKVDSCQVSRRDATIYSLLLTNGNNLGRCELTDCAFAGVVAARRGYMGWNIQNCSNSGVADGVGNVPYRLVESVSGVAVVMTAVDVYIFGEWAGAVCYSENSITGTAYLSVLADISLPAFPNGSTLFTTTRPGACCWKVVGAGVVNVTFVSTPLSSQSFTMGGNFNDAATQQPQPFSYISLREMTGSFTLVATNTFCHVYMGTSNNNGGTSSYVEVVGTANTTGNVTITGGSFRPSSPVAAVSLVHLMATYTGTMSIASSLVVRQYSPTVNEFRFSAVQTTGTPSITLSGATIVEKCSGYSVYGFDLTLATAMSVGTWIKSGTIIVSMLSPQPLVASASVVSAGTFTVSNTIDISTEGRAATGTLIIANDGNATGGTLTVSSASIRLGGNLCGSLYVINSGGQTNTITVSGIVTACGFLCTADLRFVSVLSTGTGVFSGSLILRNIRFTTASFGVNTGVAGSVATGPSSVTFDTCFFAAAFTMEATVGTLTWTGATILILNSTFVGLFTIVLTRFSSVQAFATNFNANTSNKTITATGTRPTTYRYWKCNFAARFDDIQPEVLNEYDILPAQAALVQGQPVMIDAANNYKVCVAASIVDGVALAAAGSAGTILIAVRQGRVYVTCKAGTVNGDNLVLDIVTPTQANLGAFLAGQEIGTALENVGAVVTGKCYTAVNVR